MRRRDFIALAATTAALLPYAVLAQAKRTRVIGILSLSSPGNTVSGRAALWQGLNETGYVEEQNAVAEYRYAEGHYDRLPRLARELVERKVDVLINMAGAIGTEVSKSATSSIPVVFLSADDPVQRGFVASMARPGGNLTGFAHLDVELTSKLVELAAELGTPTRTIGVLLSATSPLAPAAERMARQAADVMNLRLDIVTAGSEPEIEGAFGALTRTRPDALVVPIAANFLRRLCT
jgi:putative ABC transport system substrate-binding protein